jgi:uncharacterized protein YgbK (DUF1537 family)
VSVLADDLTGATDTAAVFARPGWRVRVRIGGPHRAAPAPVEAAPARAEARPCVDVVDLEVRDGPTDLDVRAVYAEAARRGASNGGHVYLKIDSTLRGRIAEAVEGVLSALPAHGVICAPAFPRAGRTTLGGVTFVHGIALHRSDVWQTETRPAPREVRAALRLPRARHCSLADIRDNRLSDHLRPSSAPDRGRSAGDRPAVVCDALVDDDLDLIARAGLDSGRPVVWIGSAGLAAALGRQAGVGPAEAGDPRTTHTDGRWTSDRAGRFVAVVGSTSPVAQAQVEALVSAGATGFRARWSQLADAPDGCGALSSAIQQAARRGGVVVSIGGDRSRIADRAHRAEVAAALARLVAPAVRGTSTLVLTGGATAHAVLAAIGVASLDVLGEVRPGVVLSATTGARSIQLITKAGAFGDEHTLVDVLIPVPRRLGGP